jgi:ribosomal protein S18 acetylase RimI-like enzyme
MMGGEVTLRQGVGADVPAIRALTRAAYARWVPVIGREPKPMTADYDAAVRDHRFDLLYLGDDLAALIETIREPDHLLIENVAVAPAFQGRGFGRRLLLHAEALAGSFGYSEVRLYTNQRFEDNIRLYERCGYEIFREELHPTRGVAIHMKKRVEI